MQASSGDPGPPTGAGLYVHVPFCRSRCPYCDFNVLAGAGRALRARYVAAVRAELARVAAAGPASVAPPGTRTGGWPVFGSVFVGGGTPTELAAGDLAGILRHARAVLPVAPDAEVTVEANPEDVDAETLAALVDAGLTRLSVGAQSFAPHVLDFLGRGHAPHRAPAAVAAARAAGVARVSVDLIYGAPCETDADWTATLDAAVGAGVDHLSAYALTVEANTPYAAAIARGAAGAPDEDVQAARMAVADERLGAAGLRRYEISNWARPGAQSRHNLLYWRGGDWLGVGAGAHGHWAGRRWWNLRPTARYADTVLAGWAATAGQELLDGAARRTERLMMGLRLVAGVPRAAVEPLDEAAADRLVAAGLLADDGGRLALTPAGRPLAGAVVLRLLP
ncbi:MAG TPA: radical SAM family heme chaperone HemW [Egibacteraceae bacterium]|nr:radical SAM family heme chaperone HemW [Egibacteraceae bacterium]